ncbi:hypothetical protein ACF06X_33525 [Streptomyces sp. NPDC015346]|uniref:hypothetical protein n=1 Tax=Streptomyces sp. NPDC015346 TaxID=3364954 RepID=UPI0036FB56AB
MATQDDTTPAERLRLLQLEFITPRRRGPAASRSTRPTEPAAPLDIDTVDHVQGSVAEVVALTRAAAPDAGPRPASVEGLYGWWRENTAHLEPEKQQHREAVIYRHGLEHALMLGERKVIRRHPCPGCGTWGLFWNQALQRALCVNRYCKDASGGSSTWTLSHLAQEHVNRKEKSARRAT